MRDLAPSLDFDSSKETSGVVLLLSAILDQCVNALPVYVLLEMMSYSYDTKQRLSQN